MTKELALSSLKEAIVKVGSDYIWCDTFKSKYQQERCFAYELYRKWSNIIDEYKKCGAIDKKVKVNGEVFKFIEGKYVCPDLVLHGGQDIFNMHYLACEIKRFKQCSTLKILEDLEKLVEYLNLSKLINIENVSEVSDYELVVELFMGGGIDSFKKRIKNVFCRDSSDKQQILRILNKLNNLEKTQKENMVLIFTKESNFYNEEGKNEIEFEDITFFQLTESLSLTDYLKN